MLTAMSNAFDKIENREVVTKLRILSFCAFCSSFIFYYFMIEIAPSHLDWLPGRIVVALIALASLIASFFRGLQFPWIRVSINSIIYSYIILYAYLLQINDWSIFHRWSYFVVIAIMATVVLSWRDFVYQSLFGFAAPFVVLIANPVGFLEFIHFQAANFVTYLVIGLTIHANFKYRDEVVKLTRNLVQNSKMTALGEMSAGVAHEINNPLAIIVNSMAQLQEAFESNEEFSKARLASTAERMDKATARIVRIVKGLHNFSQGDHQEDFATIDMHELVVESIDLYSEKFSAQGISFVQNLTTEPVFCFCQRRQVSQIFANLLNNAFDACHRMRRPEITITLSLQDNCAHVSVADNGYGVSPAIENQIMQPFFTTKEIGKGTGLGLSSSLGIAKYNRGDLFLDRDVSTSCFTLKLPIAKPLRKESTRI